MSDITGRKFTVTDRLTERITEKLAKRASILMTKQPARWFFVPEKMQKSLK